MGIKVNYLQQSQKREYVLPKVGTELRTRLPSVLERFAFWNERYSGKNCADCGECANGGSGDCVACKE